MIRGTDYRWIEVRLDDVPGELVAAAAAALESATGARVAIEDDLAADQPSTRIRVWFVDTATTTARLAAAVADLATVAPSLRPAVRRMTGVDWSEAWKVHHPRLRPGARIVLLPPWDTAPIETGDLAIRLEPGMAFGLGDHPSTRTTLILLERAVRAGDRVLDVGCGSGVLALAALRLGARHACGCDIEAASVAATRDNATLNGLSGQVSVFRGTVAAIDGRFDVLAMNIGAPAVLEISPRLELLLDHGGRAVLGGIRLEELPAVREVVSAAGVVVTARAELGRFAALLAER